MSEEDLASGIARMGPTPGDDEETKVPSLASRMGPIPGVDDAPKPAAADDTPKPAAADDTPKPAAADDEHTELDKETGTLLESQYEVAVKLADMQGDPNSPLYSVKRFEDLGMYVSHTSVPNPVCAVLTERGP
jgi:hypothetical protein